MSNRTTQANLRGLMRVMANTIGAPDPDLPVWTRDESGNNIATVGALVLNVGSATYGNAWAVSRIVSESGGEQTVVRGCTARELWDAMHNFLRGYDAARQGE